MSRVCSLQSHSVVLITDTDLQYYRRRELVLRIGLFNGIAPALSGACEWPSKIETARQLMTSRA